MKEGSICNKCNHRAYCDMSDEANNDNATIKGCYLYSERKTKTNADRIREMTDKELTDWYFDKFFPCVPYCSILQDGCPEHDDCKICLLEWLRQEYTP